MTRARILIMDDDPEVREVLGLGLSHAGYQVLTAASCEEAVQACRDQSPDLAILDVLMPGTSGIEVARRLTEETDTPFVFLSASGDTDVVQQAVAEGALGYLLKPIDVFQIRPSIEAALKRAGDIRDLKSGAGQNTAVRERPQTAVAVGLIMERFRLNETEAYEMIATRAQDQNRSPEAVAREIIQAAETLNLEKAAEQRD